MSGVARKKEARFVTRAHVYKEFIDRNRQDTSFVRRDSDEKEYICASCDRDFYVGRGAWIFYSLCDECFAVWNMRNLASRLCNGPREVPIVKSMCNEELINPLIAVEESN